MTVDSIPDIVFMGVVFTLRLNVANCSDRTMDLMMALQNERQTRGPAGTTPPLHGSDASTLGFLYNFQKLFFLSILFLLPDTCSIPALFSLPAFCTYDRFLPYGYARFLPYARFLTFACFLLHKLAFCLMLAPCLIS